VNDDRKLTKQAGTTNLTTQIKSCGLPLNRVYFGETKMANGPKASTFRNSAVLHLR